MTLKGASGELAVELRSVAGGCDDGQIGCVLRDSVPDIALVEMETVSFGIKIALTIFGLRGIVALAIVPWACIGTGLYDKDKKYQ